MKNTSTYLYSTQFTSFNAFSQLERIIIPATQRPKTNNEHPLKGFAGLSTSDNTFQSGTLINFRLIHLPATVKLTSPSYKRVNSHKISSLQPIQGFTAVDNTRMKFLHSIFTYYKSMSDFNHSICSNLN